MHQVGLASVIFILGNDYELNTSTAFTLQRQKYMYKKYTSHRRQVYTLPVFTDRVDLNTAREHC